jgi:hypothetical protein
MTDDVTDITEDAGEPHKEQRSKGTFPNRAGRPKGVPNKLTTAAKEAFALAFEGVGGVEKLTEWGRENPGEFFKLYARLIPIDVSGSLEHSGALDVNLRFVAGASGAA